MSQEILQVAIGARVSDQSLDERLGTRIIRVVAVGPEYNERLGALQKRRTLDECWKIGGVISMQIGKCYRCEIFKLGPGLVEGNRRSRAGVDEHPRFIVMPYDIAGATLAVIEFRTAGAEYLYPDTLFTAHLLGLGGGRQ